MSNIRKLVESKLLSDKSEVRESLYGDLSAMSDLTGADAYFDLRRDGEFMLFDKWYKINGDLGPDANGKNTIDEMRNICSKHFDAMDAELLEYMKAHNISEK